MVIKGNIDLKTDSVPITTPSDDTYMYTHIKALFPCPLISLPSYFNL